MRHSIAIACAWRQVGKWQQMGEHQDGIRTALRGRYRCRARSAPGAFVTSVPNIHFSIPLSKLYQTSEIDGLWAQCQALISIIASRRRTRRDHCKAMILVPGIAAFVSEEWRLTIQGFVSGSSETSCCWRMAPAIATKSITFIK